MRDVTLGRYYEEEGRLHALDPRTKLFSLLLYIISLFVFDSWIGFGLTFLYFLLIVKLSGIPFKYIIKGLKSVFFIIILASILNAVFGKGDWTKTFFVVWRMVAAVMASNILTLTTKPRSISDGLEKALSFLNFFHFPVHDTATIISLSFRFIPILSEEAGRIMDAQRSRGAKMGEGRLVDKAKAIMPIVIPLFISAFRRSDELSMAMDSRLYGSGERTVWRPLEYGKGDKWAYIISVLLLLSIIVLRVLP